ncbi:MAG: c-type cytochrome [Candidatus Rokuibacteriota bacterium]
MISGSSFRPLTAAAVLVLMSAWPVTAQMHHGPRPSSGAHEAHGTPPGWTFTLPKGDPLRGRAAFEKFECFKCHEVQGEKFPAPTDTAGAGPELAHMSAHHPPEFFAESIVNPSAVVERSYAAPDGSSKMPSFNDSMSVQEVVDLVAYLTGLTPPAGGGGHRH